MEPAQQQQQQQQQQQREQLTQTMTVGSMHREGSQSRNLGEESCLIAPCHLNRGLAHPASVAAQQQMEPGRHQQRQQQQQQQLGQLQQTTHRDSMNYEGGESEYLGEETGLESLHHLNSA